ncbi:hypothetical protein [Streptomyces sp. NPDC095817]|uniref:hypothetical protein n=1 Tax=Streptomyces sp. NPDC095817 TaxID=3155082 RepID=UPI00332EAD32
MFQEAPIYRQLITERGDIPAHVRGEAERIRRELQQVMPAMPKPVATVPTKSDAATPVEGMASSYDSGRAGDGA